MTVYQIPPAVHSDPGPLAPHPAPAFEPDPEDVAYWAGYSATLAGEAPHGPSAALGYTSAMNSAWYRGAIEGARDRRNYWLPGKRAGYAEAPCVPPAGAGPNQSAAWREGHAAGLAEFEEDREFDAWVSSMEAERMESAFARELGDEDVNPGGVC